jgi:hypothetical protein
MRNFTPKLAVMSEEQIAAELEEAMEIVVDQEFMHSVDADRLPYSYCQQFVDKYHEWLIADWNNEDQRSEAEVDMIEGLIREYFALPYTPKPPNLTLSYTVSLLIEQDHHILLDPSLVWKSPGQPNTDYIEGELERQLPQTTPVPAATRIFDYTSGDVIFEDGLYHKSTALTKIREAAK